MANTREWFETVEEARRRARRHLPKPVYMALVAGTEKGVTLQDWSGSRDQIIQRTERARQAGAKGLIVTLDWSFSNGRDWGSPAIPEKMDLQTLLRLAPEGIVKLGYIRDWLATAA